MNLRFPLVAAYSIMPLWCQKRWLLLIEKKRLEFYKNMNARFFLVALGLIIGSGLQAQIIRPVACGDLEIDGLPAGVTAKNTSKDWKIGPGGHAIGSVGLSGDGVDSKNNGAIVVGSPDGTLKVVIRTGDTVSSGTVFALLPPSIDASGRVAMRAGVTGTASNPLLAGSLGNLSVLVAAGDDVSADFVAESTISSIGDPQMSAGGLFAFSVSVRESDRAPQGDLYIFGCWQVSSVANWQTLPRNAWGR
ncbi:MAG: hypothetical protein ACI9DF_004143 [Verrucomicrobiales bacterium]|jgi:hypothetical protein